MPGRKKTALITGASMGIGQEFAQLFAQDHYNLVLTARSGEKLQAIKSELEEKYNIYVKCIVADLTDPKAPELIFNEIKEEGIVINILVNNAGFAENGNFLETDLASELGMIQVNITALTHLTKLFGREMGLNGGGKILNVASTAAFQPGPLMSVYYATKAYVLHFSEAIHNELKEKNVIVTTLCPGPTSTNFAERADMQNSFLFTKGVIQSADTVALEGYNGLKEGKSVVIAGTTNRILAYAVRVLPRKLVMNIAKSLNAGDKK